MAELGVLPGPSPLLSGEAPPTAPAPDRSAAPEQYLDDIEACNDYLLDGDSYEICLTNQIKRSRRRSLRPLSALRRVNPAPFAAYLRFGDLAVLSSSPERFLASSATAGPKPGRSREPVGAARAGGGRAPRRRARADEKNRAENLMIVDLLRNDLGRVCEVGSVEVPELLAFETYETVHQLVSTVRGRLRAMLRPRLRSAPVSRPVR